MGNAPDARILRWGYQHVGFWEPTQTLKFAFYLTQNPNASQWNIGCVGSLALGLCIGHVHFIFYVLISFALGSRRKCSFQWNMGLKPIFHCNARNLASAVGVGQCPRRQNLALEIPTCWYILALPYAKICFTPDAKPQRQPVEYSLRWVLGVGSRVGHVHFIFFVSISFALGSVFPVEYGLKGLGLYTFLCIFPFKNINFEDVFTV